MAKQFMVEEVGNPNNHPKFGGEAIGRSNEVVTVIMASESEVSTAKEDLRKQMRNDPKRSSNTIRVTEI